MSYEKIELLNSTLQIHQKLGPCTHLGNNNAGPSSSLIDSGLLQINRIKSRIE